MEITGKKKGKVLGGGIKKKKKPKNKKKKIFIFFKANLRKLHAIGFLYSVYFCLCVLIFFKIINI